MKQEQQNTTEQVRELTLEEQIEREMRERGLEDPKPSPFYGQRTHDLYIRERKVDTTDRGRLFFG